MNISWLKQQKEKIDNLEKMIKEKVRQVDLEERKQSIVNLETKVIAMAQDKKDARN